MNEPGSSATETVRHPWRWLTAILVVAAAFRSLSWLRSAVIFNDGPVFLELAAAIARGDLAAALAHPFHPLYPASIAAVDLLLGWSGLRFELAGVVASIAAGSAAIVALYAFVERAFDARTGLLAATLLMLHAVAIETSGNVQSEGLYLALFLASAAAGWRAFAEHSLPGAVACGAFGGLAYLTRPEGLSVPLVCGALLAVSLVRAGPGWRRRIGAGLAMAAAAALFVLPYVAALALETGELWITRKKSVEWIAGTAGPPAHFTDRDEIASDSPAPAVPDAVVPKPEVPRANPPRRSSLRRETESEARSWSLVAPALEDLGRAFVRSLRYESIVGILLGFAVLGLRPGRRFTYVGAILGFHVALLFGLIFNVGYVSTRHAMGPSVLLLGYAAAGYLAVLRRWRRPGSVILALALGATVVVTTAKTWRIEGEDQIALRRAAEWVRDRGEPSAVAARKQRVAYYAEAPYVGLRRKTPARTLDYFDSHQVGYVILNEADLGEFPGLQSMIGTSFEPVHRTEAAGERALVLAYRGRTPAAAP